MEEIRSGRKSNNQYRIKVNFKCDLAYYYLYHGLASSTDILRISLLCPDYSNYDSHLSSQANLNSDY